MSTRREFLRNTGYVILGARFFPTDTIGRYLEQQVISEQQRSILRAASVEINKAYEGGARAGLYRLQGMLVILTLQHVLREPNSQLLVSIPGIPYLWEIGNSAFQILPGRWSNTDPIVGLPLINNSFGRGALEAIAMGRLLPLQEASVSAQDTIATRGDDNTIVILKPQAYNRETNQIVCETTQGQICRGHSGQAALLMENGIITQKSAGLIMSADFVDRQQCTNLQVFIRPHN